MVGTRKKCRRHQEKQVLPRKKGGGSDSEKSREQKGSEGIEDRYRGDYREKFCLQKYDDTDDIGKEGGGVKAGEGSADDGGEGSPPGSNSYHYTPERTPPAKS